MIRVLLVDDHDLVRAGLTNLLSGRRDIEVVGQAGDGAEALRLVASAKPDVVLMDISMPGVGGIEATKAIRRKWPAVQVIALTGVAEGRAPNLMIEAGALGFLEKTTDVEEIARAVRTVAQGKPYVCQAVATKMVFMRQQPDHGSPFDSLSPREYEIMRLMIEGERQEAICRRLNLSPSTVSTHRSRILRKIGVNSEARLVIEAIRHGVIQVA